MEIVRKMGGYSLGRADLVRRAMSKKKEDVMIAERKNFIHGIVKEDGTVEVDGALRRGVDEATANAIFDEMMDFASYAFNKSHAAAYAFVTYQTAYLKHFYPAQYMAALLSSVLDSPEKVAGYSSVCERMGIRILPPDINESIAGFAVTNGDIRFGLAVIKNVGIGCVEAITEERNANGKYKNYRDFARRTASLSVTKRVHEYLIKAGAFDALGEKRSCLLMDYESVIDSFADDMKRNVAGQLSLWGDEEETVEAFSTDIPEFSKKELLSLEKESIGYYISGHPLHEYTEDIARLSTVKFSDFQTNDTEENEGILTEYGNNLADGTPVVVCVLCSSIKTKITKNNKMMAFVTVEDLTGQSELIVFPNVYERCRAHLVEDTPLLVTGKLSFREEEEPKIFCDEIMILEHGMEAPALKPRFSKETSYTAPRPVSDTLKPQAASKKLYLKFELGKDYLLDKAKAILEAHTGDIPVYIHIEETKQTALAPKNLWVKEADPLFSALQDLLGEKNVVLK